MNRCRVSKDGIEIEVNGNGDIKILFPVFKFDGKNNTEITVSEKFAEIEYMHQGKTGRD